MIRGDFKNRTEAGKHLAEALTPLKLTDPVVLALPRGGVPVGLEIARALRAPLDLVHVRKIGAPYQRELAMAAVVDGAEPILVRNEEVIGLGMADESYLETEMERELAEIARRREVYLCGRPQPDLKGRDVIVVDDGIATGTTMRAVLKALARKETGRVVLAVPTAASDTLESLRPDVDEIVCLKTPSPFIAIGFHYLDFHQVGDTEVTAMLKEADAFLTEKTPDAVD